MFKEKITSLPLSQKSYYKHYHYRYGKAKKIVTGVTKQLAGHENANAASEGRGYLLLHLANMD